MPGPALAARSRKSDSGHAGTISITVRACRTRRNVMKPGIQCALTQWIPGSMPVRHQADLQNQHQLIGNAVLMVLAVLM